MAGVGSHWKWQKSQCNLGDLSQTSWSDNLIVLKQKCSNSSTHVDINSLSSVNNVEMAFLLFAAIILSTTF